jgi:hypothetical protein
MCVKIVKLQQMLADHRKLLYPGCTDGLKKLGITLELLQEGNAWCI